MERRSGGQDKTSREKARYTIREGGEGSGGWKMERRMG